MAWTPSPRELPGAFGTAPVPDIESLRRAALQASWRRDRRVAQRRMAMRWIAWYALRGLPLLAIAIAAAVLLWLSNRPNEPHTGRPTERVRAAANPPLQRARATSSASVAPASAAAMATPATPAAPEPHHGEPVLQLRLGSPLQSASPTASASASPSATPPATGPQSTGLPLAHKAPSATDSPSPQLKPDNWLHSKEP